MKHKSGMKVTLIDYIGHGWVQVKREDGLQFEYDVNELQLTGDETDVELFIHKQAIEDKG